jgi:hypothetical protein
MILAADTNWFYSTLAQSTAAIIGLAGGFLVQQLLTQRTTMAQDRGSLRVSFVTEWASFAGADARLAIEQVKQAMIDGIAVAEQQQTAGADRFAPPTWDRLFSLSHSRGQWNGSAQPVAFDVAIPAMCDLRDAAHDFLNDAPGTEAEYHKRIRTGKGLGSAPAWMAKLQQPPEPWSNDPSTFWDYMPRQRWLLAQIWMSCDAHAKDFGTKLAAFRSRLVPSSFYVLLVILFGLLAAGVIAPLFYLSARSDASWIVLIALFIPLAAAFLAYMVWELHRLRQAADMTRDAF